MNVARHRWLRRQRTSAAFMHAGQRVPSDERIRVYRLLPVELYRGRGGGAAEA